MTHPLDRPVWNSLHDRLAHLAIGGGKAVGFERSCEVFVAAADHSHEALEAVTTLVPPGGEASFVEHVDWPLPPGTARLKHAVLTQMIAENGIGEPDTGLPLLELGDADAPEMLALATLCRPGPYLANTHKMGGFVGIRDDDGRLIAMAGERYQIGRFTEISAVSTHPDARGKGLARNLMRVVGSRIAARGEIIFLHTYPDNHGAIALYEQLGFRPRAEINYTIFQRD